MNFRGFIISVSLPLICANFFLFNMWFFNDFFESAFFKVGFFHGVVEYFGVAAYFMIFGLISSYSVTIIVGYPFYLFAKRFYRINFVGVIMMALILAVFPVILFLNAFTFDQYLLAGNCRLIIGLALSGLLAGVIFWKNIKDELTGRSS